MMITKTLTLHRPGGLEIHVTELAKRLAKKNQLDIVCRKLPNKFFKKKFNQKEYKFKIHDVTYPGIGVDAIDNLSSVPAFRKKISKLLNKNNYDVVHGHGITSLAYLKNKKETPFVYTLHGISSWHLVGYKQPLRSILKILFDTERHCVEGADKIICVSKRTIEDAHKYYGIEKSKCVYVPSGIDVKTFLPRKIRKERTGRIGFVGYMHDHKGIRFLLKAMKIVKDKVPDSKLYLIGKGDATKFKKMAKSLGIENDTLFLTNITRNKLIKLYKTFDVFVLPSQYEGFGTAALEAMTSGVPLVVSDTGQLSEFAKGTGFVVDPRNINQMAGRIENILKDDKLRRKLSKNCRKKAKYYEWNRITKMTLKVYKDLL